MLWKALKVLYSICSVTKIIHKILKPSIVAKKIVLRVNCSEGNRSVLLYKWRGSNENLFGDQQSISTII